jgi:hypothetical protein
MKKQPVSASQVQRFIETARVLDCEEDKEKFEASLREIATPKPIREPKKQRAAKKEG